MKMKNKLIAFDLDGTLLHPILKTRLVSKRYVSMLQDYYDSGVSLCIVSGRGIDFANKIEEAIGRKCHYIGLNGTLIPSIGLYEYIDFEVVYQIEKYDYKMLYFTFDGIVYAKEKNKEFFIQDYERRKKAKPLYAEEYTYNDKKLEEAIKSNRIGKIIISGRDLPLDVDGLVIFRKESSDTIELTKKGYNKALGLNLLTEKMNISPDDVYVLGDEGNDKEMLQSFTNSFIIDHPYNQHLQISTYRIKNMLDLKRYLK